MKKVFIFDEAEFNKELLGGKGANLVSMKRNGLPIPNGVVISTEACREYFSSGKLIGKDLEKEILEELKKLELQSGKHFQGKEKPLLVSVRSGAPISMPGMMDTILNLGLNDEVVKTLINKTKKSKFVYEIYTRFIEMFGEIVKNIDKEKFHEIKKLKGNKESEKESKEIIKLYKELYKKETGTNFPENPIEQILLAVDAIFNSWNTDRAKYYRKLNDISDNVGTGVVIQEMVFGNYNEFSGTGVAFTRNPSTGEKEIFGEYLLEAQGEDIVAGIRTPLPLSTLKKELPEVYEEFVTICKELEKTYKNMQDIEFTIENKKLFILQTRAGKRSPEASIKIAVDLAKEEVITKEEAIVMIEPNMISKILNGNFDEEDRKKKTAIGKGIPGSAGVAVGKVALCTGDIKGKEDWILVRVETSPEDIKGMNLAKGIATIKGGATSHGAVVARGMGKCCITGCADIKINEEKRYLTLNGAKIKAGDIISIDGYTGDIYLGSIKLKKPEIGDNLKKIMQWCNSYKTLEVRMNADTPQDVKIGKKLGAKGVGLCRTEHMFFEEEKIWNIREMIISSSLKERNIALKKLLVLQKKDFYDIMKILDGDALNIRLLDPPLHEFLPKTVKDIEKLASNMGLLKEEVQVRINNLKEENPMIGHRGCRLAITFPEIYDMQSRAIIESALLCKEEGVIMDLEIMVPFIGGISEFKYIKKNIIAEIEKVFEEKGQRIKYKLGTMMELPRACLIADEIAEESDFFSFGTNDLTQMTYGISRDDSINFIEYYKEKDIIKRDPFTSIDTRGVGKLLVLATKLGREVKKGIKIGVCGEHGGDSKSIEFFDNLGINYVSCSPYRVPIAIVAAARSAIINKEEKECKKNKLKKIKLKK
ncbi:MAG: pyruvate, phosphate dikinase [Fusobacteriaceae bacterium]